MNEQEALWQGQFGDQYLDRNIVDPVLRQPFWNLIANSTGAATALEVGCSRGHNLLALKAAGVRTAIGIDINERAVLESRAKGLLVMRGNALMAALFGPAFDLVFTVGVLIHISPEEIHSSMAAIAAGSKRFVLSVEYEADHETEVEYRGQKLALWKRSYGMMYRQRGFKVVDFGDLKKEDGFDDCRYWLMERT